MLSFHVKFVQTDRWTDRWPTVKQYAPRSFDTGAKYCAKRNTMLLKTVLNTIQSINHSQIGSQMNLYHERPLIY